MEALVQSLVDYMKAVRYNRCVMKSPSQRIQSAPVDTAGVMVGNFGSLHLFEKKIVGRRK